MAVHIVFIPFLSRAVPHLPALPHARGILYESAQPTGDQLMSLLFPLVLLPVRACVLGSATPHPKHPQTLSPSQFPQLSAPVRGVTGGRASVPDKWAVLPSAQIQAKPPIEGLGASNSCRIFR